MDDGRNGTAFRMKQVEDECKDHEVLIDVLRLSEVEFRQRLNSLEDNRKRMDKEIDKINESREGMLRILNDKMDAMQNAWTKGHEALVKVVADNLSLVTASFTTFKVNNNKNTVIILTAIVVTCVSVILSRLVTIPGAHV